MSTSKSEQPHKKKKPGFYHHGDLRRSMIAATFELLRKEGIAGVTLRGAARLAGVSQAAPYRHFANREALLASAGAEAFTDLVDSMAAHAVAAGSDPLLRFRGIGVAYVCFAAEDPSRFRFMFGSDLADKSRYPELEQAANRSFEILLEAISECQRAGAVRKGPAEPLALLAWSAVHGLAALIVDRQTACSGLKGAPEEVAARLTEDLNQGLAP